MVGGEGVMAVWWGGKGRGEWEVKRERRGRESQGKAKGCNHMARLIWDRTIIADRPNHSQITEG